MTQILYMCECGCVNTHDKLIRISFYDKSRDKQRSRVDVCAKHGKNGTIKYMLVRCADCGEYFRAERVCGGVPQRCETCLPLHRKYLKARASMRYREQKQELLTAKKKFVKINKVPKFCKEVCGAVCIKEEALWEVNCGIDLKRRQHEQKSSY